MTFFRQSTPYSNSQTVGKERTKKGTWFLSFEATAVSQDVERYQAAWRERRGIPEQLDGVPLTIHRGPHSSRHAPAVVEAPRSGEPLPHQPPVLDLKKALSQVEDGDTVMSPNYYRQQSGAAEALLRALGALRKRGLCFSTHLLYSGTTMELVTQRLQDGVLERIETGGFYGPMGSAVTAGALERPVWMYGYGARTAMLRAGRLAPDWAFIDVPYAQVNGRVSGIMGPADTRCGSMGIVCDDARYAKKAYIALAQQIGSDAVRDDTGPECSADALVQLAPGTLSNLGIASGTTDLSVIKGKLANDPVSRAITDSVVLVLEAANLLRHGVNFQVGAGTVSLATLYKLAELFERNGTRGGFSVGGLLPIHIEMLATGSLSGLYSGQTFSAENSLFVSLAEDPRHKSITLWDYYCALNPERLVRKMNFSILGALQVDTSFNANVLTGSDGIIRGGLGGANDAATTQFSILATPLVNHARRAGVVSPKIVSEVITVTTPGSDVDVVVTEDAIAVNPDCRSLSAESLRCSATESGLCLMTIEELAELSLAKASLVARETGAKLMVEPPERTDRVVAVVHNNLGEVLDVVRQIEKRS